MKKIMIVVLLLSVVLGSICYAAEVKWTLLNETKDTAMYLDLDSITSATLNMKSVKQFNAKLVSKPQSDYRIDMVYVNPETKDWTVIREERYDSKGKLLDAKEYLPSDKWNSYDDPLWKPMLNKVMERR